MLVAFRSGSCAAIAGLSWIAVTSRPVRLLGPVSTGGMLMKTGKVSATAVRFIKLGRGGKFERAAL